MLSQQEEPIPRKHRRTRGMAPVWCNHVRGRLMNISRSGLALTIASHYEDFKIGEQYPLTIKFAEKQEDDQTKDVPYPSETKVTGEKKIIEPLVANFQGILRYTEMNLKNNRMLIGVEIADMSEIEKQNYHKIILYCAQHFAKLDSIEEWLDHAKEPKTLSVSQMEPLFEWACQNFQGLPDEVQQQLTKISRILEKTKSLNAR